MARLEVHVDNRIRVPLSADPDLLDELREENEHKNPEYGAKKAMGIPTWGVPPEIVLWDEEGEHLTLPRGMTHLVREVLSSRKVPIGFRDRRIEGSPSPNFPQYVGKPLRRYQQEALDMMLAKEQGIIRSPTGSGKTTIAFAAIAAIGLNALVILPTGGLFKQWTERAQRELGLSGNALGMIRGKTCRLRPVTIAMQQTLAAWGEIPPEVLEYFGHVIIDEAQLASARTYVQVVDQFPARYRFAVSADERRKDRKEFIAHSLFGKPISEIDREELEEEGHVLDVEIRVIPTEFRADWYGLPPEPPDDGEDEPEPEGEEKVLDFNRLLEEMTADRKRNALALKIIGAEVQEGQQAIILSARREHAKLLSHYFVKRRIPNGYLLGDQEKGDEAEFERTRHGLMDGSVRVGVGTYEALGFGIDLPAVGIGAAMTPIAGNLQKLNQVRGRLCRPNPEANKQMGKLYLLWDRYVYPGHLANILRGNKSVVVWNGKRWEDGRAWKARHRDRLTR